MYVRTLCAMLVLLTGVAAAPTAGAEAMKIGLGRVVITPDAPVWMAGYASRTEPGTGKLHDLWTKAMAIEDASGNKVVIVTADIIGFSMDMTDAVSKRVEEAHGIPRSNLLFNSSHTHCGPVVKNDGLHITYGLEGEDEARAVEYTAQLAEMVYQAIDAALIDLAPGTLSWGIGEATFAKNRRAYGAGGVSNEFNPIGPVDHDVPVLLAKGADGVVRGVLFGYACHNTTLSVQEFNGDYAGFAQLELEKSIPGCTALFVQNCGGDANPLPRIRGKDVEATELASMYGKVLAEAVRQVIATKMPPLNGPIRAAMGETELSLQPGIPLEELKQRLPNLSGMPKREFEHFIRQYETLGSPPDRVKYPVQVWRIGTDFQFIALTGETVVDYSLKFKAAYGWNNTWVCGYNNDLTSYVPSLRVLKEGGYEGVTGMFEYGHRAPYTETVEELITTKVEELMKQTK